MRTRKIWIGLAFGLVILCALAFAVPSVNGAVLRRADQLRLRIIYLLKPPENEVFTPGQQDAVAKIVAATLTAMGPSKTATPTLAPTSTATLAPDVPTPTLVPPTPTSTPLPADALIADVPYVDQNFGYNNCAPANLTMVLKFWGFQGTREEVATAVKPFAKDKNVMPYELVDYVNSQTQYRALNRIGGTLDTLKSLIAAGFPVLVERGVYLRDLTGRVSWMGHYQVIYGYNDAEQKFQVKDSFEANGDKFVETYPDLLSGWRSFNYTFVLVYAPDRKSQAMEALGSYADEAAAARKAYDLAGQDIDSTQGQDQFFSWYNRGSSQVALSDFAGAAQTFDQAFAVYAKLPADYSVRPWRIVWYETEPYFAYYYTGRYNDVINLADTTISSASEPYIEESFYWRAMAKVAAGDRNGAIDDLRKSLEYHPNFGLSVAELQQLGVAP